MSIRLLQNSDPDWLHQVSDDLESFAWLVLDLALRMIRWTTTGNHTPQSIHVIFSEANYLNNRWQGGNQKKNVVEVGNKWGLPDLHFVGNSALTDWWRTIQSLLDVFYDDLRRVTRGVRGIELTLQDHSTFKEAFQKALGSEGWPQSPSSTIQHVASGTSKPRHPQHALCPKKDSNTDNDATSAMASIDEEGQLPTKEKNGMSASMDSSGKPRTRSRKAVPPSDRITRAASRNTSSETGSSQPAVLNPSRSRSSRG